MKIHSICLVLLVAGCQSAQAPDEAVLRQVVKQKAAEINDALLKEDFGKFADLTHPKVVELMGGRQKMM